MRQIFVDSRDRVAGTTTDFRIQLPETLTIDGRKHRARIDNLRIPLCVPTIQAGINDTIVVQLGSQKYTATIQAGNYDGPTLANRIQGALTVWMDRVVRYFVAPYERLLHQPLHYCGWHVRRHIDGPAVHKHVECV